MSNILKTLKVCSFVGGQY